MSSRRYTREELQAELLRWNQQHPIGTAVRSDIHPDGVHRTRTEAVALFDQKPVIYLDGFNGYFDLHEIHPVAAGNESPVAAASLAGTPAAAPRERLAVIFPGQGAQSKGMGKALFDAYPDLVSAADAILGYSIRSLCLDDPDNRLNQTACTQPALYVVNALTHLRMQADGTLPDTVDYVAGHSLGEYNALLAAGVFDFETGLRLVAERGRLMSQASGGGMAAVVGLPAGELRAALDAAGLDTIDMANFNSPSQTVISGPAADIDKAIEALRGSKATVLPLKVSAAFHSRYMQDAQQAFAGFLEGFTFAPPKTTVIANATAMDYDPAQIAGTLSRQIASPVLWTDSVRRIAADGDVRFVEVGSRILTRMVKEIRETPAV